MENVPSIFADKHKEGFDIWKNILNDLGYKIVHGLTNQLVITPPAILSSVMLMHRIGISDDKLSEKAQWLSR
jgi:hypothetical protein